MDLLIAGEDEDGVYTKLFNNENGNFSEKQGIFRGVRLDLQTGETMIWTGILICCFPD